MIKFLGVHTSFKNPRGIEDLNFFIFPTSAPICWWVIVAPRSLPTALVKKSRLGVKRAYWTTKLTGTLWRMGSGKAVYLLTARARVQRARCTSCDWSRRSLFEHVHLRTIATRPPRAGAVPRSPVPGLAPAPGVWVPTRPHEPGVLDAFPPFSASAPT